MWAVRVRALPSRLAGCAAIAASTSGRPFGGIPPTSRPHNKPPRGSAAFASREPAHAVSSCLPTERRLRLLATHEAETAALAALLAADLGAGDCYCLLGEVGAGKSALSRAFIRFVIEDDAFPVPSPTYLLQNTYDEHAGAPIHHFDLYRLSGEADTGRLSLSDSFSQAVCLIEWAERLEGSAPQGRMDVRIKALSEELASRYAKYVQHSGAGGELADDWDEDDDDDDDMEEMRFVDRKWRLFELSGHGERMAAKLDAVEERLRAAPYYAGLPSLLPATDDST